MATRSATQISMRAPVAQRDLIDRAARAAHKSRTDFMLEAATAAAHEALMNKNEFILDEDDYRNFREKLRAPVAENEALVRLLESTPPWER